MSPHIKKDVAGFQVFVNPMQDALIPNDMIPQQRMCPDRLSPKHFGQWQSCTIHASPEQSLKPGSIFFQTGIDGAEYLVPRFAPAFRGHIGIFPFHGKTVVCKM